MTCVGLAGRYTVYAVFGPGATDGTTPAEDAWQGRLVSAPMQITLRE